MICLTDMAEVDLSVTHPDWASEALNKQSLGPHFSMFCVYGHGQEWVSHWLIAKMKE